MLVRVLARCWGSRARIRPRPAQQSRWHDRPRARCFSAAAARGFLSWSSDRSRRGAEALRALIAPRLPTGGEVFFSLEMQPGAPALREMLDLNLRETDVHVVVVTRESAVSPWVIWETASSWGRGKTIVPFFVDVRPSEVAGPLRHVAQGVRVDDLRGLERGIRAVVEAADGTWGERSVGRRNRGGAGRRGVAQIMRCTRPSGSCPTTRSRTGCTAIFAAAGTESSGRICAATDLTADEYRREVGLRPRPSASSAVTVRGAAPSRPRTGRPASTREGSLCGEHRACPLGRAASGRHGGHE